MELSLLVLAAGIGRRYGGLKQMDPVGPGGEFILDYSVYDALRAGISSVVFVIRQEFEEAFRGTVGRRIEGHVKVRYVCQELRDIPERFPVPEGRAKPWGTGHAVWVARHHVPGPFMVINADDFYGRETFATMADFLTRTADVPDVYAMVGFPLRNTLSDRGTVARGICQVSPEGFLQSIVERTHIEKTALGARYLDERGQWHPLSGGEIVSMNVWGFKPTVFAHLEREFRHFLERHSTDGSAEFFIPSVVHHLIEEGRVSVRVLSSLETWVGVTYQEEKPLVERHIRSLISQGVYPERLWS